MVQRVQQISDLRLQTMWLSCDTVARCSWLKISSHSALQNTSWSWSFRDKLTYFNIFLNMMLSKYTNKNWSCWSPWPNTGELLMTNSEHSKKAMHRRTTGHIFKNGSTRCVWKPYSHTIQSLTNINLYKPPTKKKKRSPTIPTTPTPSTAKPPSLASVRPSLVIQVVPSTARPHPTASQTSPIAPRCQRKIACDIPKWSNNYNRLWLPVFSHCVLGESCES